MSGQTIDGPTDLKPGTRLTSNRQGSQTSYEIATFPSSPGVEDIPMKGGLSLTYPAVGPTGEHFAIKFPYYDSSEHANDPYIVDSHMKRERDVLERLEREAGGLRGVMSIHDTVDAAHLYSAQHSSRLTDGLVVDWVPGDEFEELGEDDGIDDIQRVRKLILEAAACLERIHAHSVVYRDLKADNIKLTPDGDVVVLDFNGCVDVHKSRRGSGSGGGGTNIGVRSQGNTVQEDPEYPPEASDDNPSPTPAWDVYQLGKLAEYLALGPFNASQMVSRSEEVNLGLKPSLSLDRRDNLSKIVKKATASEAADRYANAGVLRRVLQGDPYDPEKSLNNLTILMERQETGRPNKLIGENESFGQAKAGQAHIPIQAPDSVSAEHGWFEFDNDQGWLYHDISTNGTLVKPRGGDQKVVLSDQAYTMYQNQGALSDAHIRSPMPVREGYTLDLAPKAATDVTFRLRTGFPNKAK